MESSWEVIEDCIFCVKDVLLSKCLGKDCSKQKKCYLIIPMWLLTALFR